MEVRKVSRKLQFKDFSGAVVWQNFKSMGAGETCVVVLHRHDGVEFREGDMDTAVFAVGDIPMVKRGRHFDEGASQMSTKSLKSD